MTTGTDTIDRPPVMRAVDPANISLFDRIEPGLWRDVLATICHDDAEKLAPCGFTIEVAALALDEALGVFDFAQTRPGTWFTLPYTLDMAVHTLTQYTEAWAMLGARLGGRFVHRPVDDTSRPGVDAQVTKLAMEGEGRTLRHTLWQGRAGSPVMFTRHPMRTW